MVRCKIPLSVKKMDTLSCDLNSATCGFEPCVVKMAKKGRVRWIRTIVDTYLRRQDMPLKMAMICPLLKKSTLDQCMEAVRGGEIQVQIQPKQDEIAIYSETCQFWGCNSFDS